MKYMIASDIHGSAHYCRLLKERYLEERADKLLLLGDLLYDALPILPRRAQPVAPRLFNAWLRRNS